MIIALAIIKSNCKKEFTTRKICWITVWSTLRLVLSPTMKIGLGNSNEMCLQGRWGLITVLIYHPSKTQHFIMIRHCCSRPWMLLGSAHHKSENMNTQEWLILPPFVVGDLVIIQFIDANWRIPSVILQVHIMCLYFLYIYTHTDYYIGLYFYLNMHIYNRGYNIAHMPYAHLILHTDE
jgi:hypothetical protein